MASTHWKSDDQALMLLGGSADRQVRAPAAFGRRGEGGSPRMPRTNGTIILRWEARLAPSNGGQARLSGRGIPPSIFEGSSR